VLFHVSEESGIERFEPRASTRWGPVVWAIDAERLRNYLLPRECPRVTFYAGPSSSASDVGRFLGSRKAVVAIETGWLARVRAARLHCYRLPERTFTCVDACAGYFVSPVAVDPAAVEVVDDIETAMRDRDVELRLLPNLWPLHEAVAASTLLYSMIRMVNAQAAGKQLRSQP